MAIIYDYFVLCTYVCKVVILKKFIKLCAESNIYYTCDLIKEGGGEAGTVVKSRTC